MDTIDRSNVVAALQPEYEAAPGPTPAASTTPEGWPIISADEWQAAHDELQLERVERARAWDLQRQEVRELTAVMKKELSPMFCNVGSVVTAAQQLVDALVELERLEEGGK